VKPHTPALHVAVAPDGGEQTLHAAPAFPHAAGAVPAMHCPEPQQPEHDVESQTHLPAAQ
jgi:hypothetical protein